MLSEIDSRLTDAGVACVVVRCVCAFGGQSDSDIRDGGRYHDVLLTPHGAVWQVHSTAEAHGLFERWERSSQAQSAMESLDPHTQTLHSATSTTMLTPAMTTTRMFAEGSWEFAAQTIVNDGAYQAALFRLGHWLSEAKRIRDVEALAAFVLGMHHVVQALAAATQAFEVAPVYTHTTTSSSSSKYARDATSAISYPAYDVQKNAAVARMRLQTGLEVLVSLHRDSKTPRSSKALDALAASVFPHSRSLREQAIDAVRELLPVMRARDDEHIGVFSDFLDSHSSASTTESGTNAATHRHEATTSAADAKGANTKPKKRKRRAKKTKATKKSQRQEATLSRP